MKFPTVIKTDYFRKSETSATNTKSHIDTLESFLPHSIFIYIYMCTFLNMNIWCWSKIISITSNYLPNSMAEFVCSVWHSMNYKSEKTPAENFYSTFSELVKYLPCLIPWLNYSENPNCFNIRIQIWSASPVFHQEFGALVRLKDTDAGLGFSLELFIHLTI